MAATRPRRHEQHLADRWVRRAQPSCDRRPGQSGRPSFSRPTTRRPTWTTKVVQGEGSVNNPDIFEDYDDLTGDPVTGPAGPVRMPRNGMMRTGGPVNGVKQAWAVSSHAVLNNNAETQAQPLRDRGRATDLSASVTTSSTGRSPP